MAKIPEYIIEEIRSKISISDVISQYVTLVPKGGRLWGICPFHNEKTPSFTVNEEKGFFHCFGCGKGGSVFNFLMEIDNLSFVEAAQVLSEKSGVHIKQESQEDIIKRDERDVLYELYSKLSESFHYILTNKDEAKEAREYLKNRRISDEMIDTFKIGYAPASPDWLYLFLRSKNYSEKLLSKSGIFSRNNPTYPLFMQRIIFPIMNNKGMVVAFGGRTLDKNQKAKYLNTPETPIFRKREQLFGLFQGLSHIKTLHETIICEGYFDVVALFQSGVRNATAPLGTAFTDEQANIIRRYADTCVLFFDQDSAGREATRKSILVLERAGITSQVVEAEEKSDPADLLQKNSETHLNDICKNRINGFDYLVKSALNKYDITLPEGKLSVFKEVKPYIEIIESEIKKHSYLKLLADVIDIDEMVIQRELQGSSRLSSESIKRDHQGRFHASEARTSHTRGNYQNQGENSALIHAATLSADMFLMLTLVNNRQYFQRVRKSVSIQKIIDPEAAEIYTALEESLREGETSFEYLLERIEDNTIRQMVIMSFGQNEFIEEAENIINEAVKKIKLRSLFSKQKKIVQQIKAASVQGINEIDLSKLLFEKKFIDEEIKNLRKS
ncbi:MAG: DNA primase [Spirochaetia bacterium]|nr:DNA primase [Spirochaetia bacterium]